MSTKAKEPAPGCDTSEMLTIHRLMRRLFADAPGLVLGVADGNRPRASVIADHVEEIAAGLHLHHHTEDLLLWDVLEQRAPACALHIGKMRAQHAVVSRLLAELTERLPRWRETAGSSERDVVAAILEDVSDALEAHLGQEERDILPVAGESMSQAEWDQLGKHGMSQIPKDRMLIQLGMMLQSMPAEERAGWLRAHVPPMGRLLYTLLGRRQFESHYRTVYGAAPAA